MSTPEEHPQKSSKEVAPDNSQEKLRGLSKDFLDVYNDEYLFQSKPALDAVVKEIDGLDADHVANYSLEEYEEGVEPVVLKFYRCCADANYVFVKLARKFNEFAGLIVTDKGLRTDENMSVLRNLYKLLNNASDSVARAGELQSKVGEMTESRQVEPYGTIEKTYRFVVRDLGVPILDVVGISPDSIVGQGVRSLARESEDVLGVLVGNGESDKVEKVIDETVEGGKSIAKKAGKKVIKKVNELLE